MTTIQEAFKELRLEELKQKRAVNEAKQKEEKKKIQEGLLSNFVPDPSEIPEVSTVKNAVSRRGKSLAQLGEEAEAKEKVCPECGKEVCECDKQINEDNEWENLHINSAVHKIKFCIDYYKNLQQHSPILRHEYQTRSKIHLNRLNDLFKYLEEEANDILKLKFAEKTYHAIKQKFYSDIQAADEKGDDSLKYSAINNAYLEAYEGLNDIFRHIISSKDPLDEEIEDEVNNGEIYSPDDVTDEEIDDMLDWMLHNGHYGKYTYNLDTVEGYQRLVSDAALNMISDEGIEPKSALARDLRGTSEFKEWEKAVTERLKAVYGIDPHDFDADLVEDVADTTKGTAGYDPDNIQVEGEPEELSDILYDLNTKGLKSHYANKATVGRICSSLLIDEDDKNEILKKFSSDWIRSERAPDVYPMLKAYTDVYKALWQAIWKAGSDD